MGGRGQSGASRSGAQSNDTAKDVFALGIQFDEVVEFLDKNHDSMYSPGIDEVVHRVHLGRAAFRPGNLSESQARDVEGNAVKVSARTAAARGRAHARSRPCSAARCTRTT